MKNQNDTIDQLQHLIVRYSQAPYSDKDDVAKAIKDLASTL